MSLSPASPDRQNGSFPSLVIRAGELVPRGGFAESQAEFLNPDEATVAQLAEQLRAHQVGVVAHFYMDPELQGVLTACDWPHIHISDSLLMADAAVKMVEQGGMKAVVVLGVDFMSENVRAMVDAAGRPDIPIYRVAAEPIGCSLAEAAAAPAYEAFLEQAAQVPRSLHVIYINTGLDTKARSHHLVPTITCTSSNVVQTMLQATAQIPGASIWYGPDTYMGQNLRVLFDGLSQMGPEAIAALHPEHAPGTVRGLIERLHHFDQGTCIVHHMFGREVVAALKSGYGSDVLITAHLEVPGEMFELALAAQRQGRGVVGSTANILGFITDKLDAALGSGSGGRLRFVLGTEAGMITAIVRRVQDKLRQHAAGGGTPGEVEIIFPVASEAIAPTDDQQLPIVPGAAGGEGCSASGGCVTCPYMKMSSLDALLDLLDRLGSEAPADLTALYPRLYTETVGGRTAAEVGGEPILHMRAFQRTGRLPQALVDDVLSRRPRD